jgi:hypothetical protein
VRVLQDPKEGAARGLENEQKSAALLGGKVLQQLLRHGPASSRGCGGTKSGRSSRLEKKRYFVQLREFIGGEKARLMWSLQGKNTRQNRL